MFFDFSRSTFLWIFCLGLSFHSLGLAAQYSEDYEQANTKFWAYNDTILALDRHKNPEQYYSYYFKQMELLESLQENEEFILHWHSLQGYNFKYFGFHNQSNRHLKHYLQKYQEFESQLSEEYKWSQWKHRNDAYDIMAYNYAELNKLDSAKYYHQKNIDLVESIDSITLELPDAYNNFGIYYFWYKKDLDSAFVQVKKASYLVNEYFPDNLLKGSIDDILADVYLARDDIAQAKDIYLSNFHFFRNNKTSHTEIQIDIFQMVSAARQYLKLAEETQDKNYIEELEEYLVFYDKNYPEYQEEVIQLKLDFLYSYLHIAKLRNDQDKIIELYNAINKNSRLKIAKIENKVDTNAFVDDLFLNQIRDNLNIRLTGKEVEIKNQRLINILIFLLAIILLSTVYFMYDRRNKNLALARNKLLLAKKEAEVYQIQKQNLENSLQSKKRDLTDFAIGLSQYQQWSSKISEKLDEIMVSRGRKRAKLMQDLEFTVNNKLDLDTKSTAFYEKLDKLSNSFYSDLKGRHPNLSKTDVRLCSFIRLKLESKTIATLQNISLSSLHTSRYRLRKKMELSDTQDLDDYISRI
ncbi:MAG TPA: hypothetical protein VJ973_10550 [Christiangramia sp.]|nr:hypothetical protein [Christiangramia sp.]